MLAHAPRQASPQLTFDVDLHNMSRPQGLDARLAELEREFRTALAVELAKVAQGRSSVFLRRKIPGVFDGRYYQSEHVGRLERLEKDILSLCRKLGMAVPGPLVGLINEFWEAVRAVDDAAHGGKKRAAKNMLNRIEPDQKEHANSPHEASHLGARLEALLNGLGNRSTCSSRN